MILLKVIYFLYCTFSYLNDNLTIDANFFNLQKIQQYLLNLKFLHLRFNREKES